MLNVKQTLCMILLGCLFINVDAKKENATENNQTDNLVTVSQICSDEKDEKNENTTENNQTDNSVTVSQTSNDEKDKKENEIKNEKIEVDCMIPIGEACEPCQHLRKNNLRISAFPLDWMMSYSLETAIHFLETKFADFFENIE